MALCIYEGAAQSSSSFCRIIVSRLCRLQPVIGRGVVSLSTREAHRLAQATGSASQRPVGDNLTQAISQMDVMLRCYMHSPWTSTSRAGCAKTPNTLRFWSPRSRVSSACSWFLPEIFGAESLYATTTYSSELKRSSASDRGTVLVHLPCQECVFFSFAAEAFVLS